MGILSIVVQLASSWLPHVLQWKGHKQRHRIVRRSTPFEADFYNPYESRARSSSLAVPPDTQLVLGLNKYSHDTTLCAANAATGEILFALSKERITRKKHDSGNVASLVETCLESLDLQLENVKTVVMNNHHYRIRSIESNIRQLEWESGLQINGGGADGYEEPENLLQHADRHELSHHIAHAYSTATQAPFLRGICVVADGMGETYRTMMEGVDDPHYTSDFSFPDAFPCIPSNIAFQAATSVFDWREAESVYIFSKTADSIDIRPLFKRFTKENSPPTLYNHGFENMDSVGAVYSRASSHIFSDWNSCGKVMGLAPWAQYSWTDGTGATISPHLHSEPIMSGSLYSEEDPLEINRTLLEGIPHCSRNDPDLFEAVDGTRKKRYDFDENLSIEDGSSNDHRLPTGVALEAIALAHRVQTDMEAIMIDFVRHFKDETGETNLCVAGGVALNSVLNGRLARELGFNQTFISPYPGDDGIAVGCCAFGLFGNARLDRAGAIVKRPPIWTRPFSPYLGPDPSQVGIREAIDKASPWLLVEAIRNEDQRLKIMAGEVESGGVVAWYRSRSELGPRALGHRSIIADPRKKGLVRFINEHVKSRESFRPFAPSVLAEEVSNWFDIGDNAPADFDASPFMSMTALVHMEKRSIIPAVTHVDGSSRLQSVTKAVEPLYHKFISAFFKLTGVPMVLNTSFNTLPSEPIVETPADAIRSFLYSMGSIEMLVLDDYIIKRKKPDLQKLLGEASRSGDVKTEPACPKRAGAVSFQSSFEVLAGETDDELVTTTTKVRMPGRPMHGNGNEWFTLVDELEGEILAVCDGTVTLNDIMATYTAVDENSALGQEDLNEAQNLLQNIVRRLVRLYEHTLLSW
jgi:predicted NodU family carbamoyl transferase